MKKLLSALCLTSAITSAHAVLIDFDSLEVANSNLNSIGSGIYTEDGFTLSGSPMYYAGQTNYLYAGSAGMHLRANSALITLTSSSGDAFSIDSIALSILSPNGSSPAVTFTGYLAGGGTVTESFTPLSFGFTDFFFSDSFANLLSVTWAQGPSEGSAHQFDNINLNVADVPEPGILALMGLGLAGMGIRRLKK